MIDDKVLLTESSLEDIADAIREKNGTENTYKPREMAGAIRALDTSTEWGEIGGTLSDQTDLKNALDAKQDTLTFDSTPTASSSNPVTSGGVYTALENKVDKETGKGLSTNDYTTADKDKLAGVAAGAEVNVIETIKVDGTALTPASKAVNIDLSGKKNVQSAVSDPTASGNALSFIDTISQNAQGVITATKKSVTTDATPTQSSTNPVQSGGVYSELSALNSSLSDINTALSGAASETTGQSILTTEMAINTTLNTLLTRLADAPTEEAGSLIVQDLVQGNLLLAHLAINIEESGVF